MTIQDLMGLSSSWISTKKKKKNSNALERDVTFIKEFE